MKNKVVLLMTALALIAGCATRVDVEIVDKQGPKQPVRQAMANPNAGLGLNQNQLPVQPVQPIRPVAPPQEAAIVPSASGGIPQVVAPNPANNRIPVNFEQTIYFDFDSSVVKQDYMNLLQRHAAFFKAGKASKVVIEGHTDVRGSAEYNLSLGQQRSEAVAKVLRQFGVPATAIDAISFGKERPAAEGETDTAHAQNRRAFIAYE